MVNDCNGADLLASFIIFTMVFFCTPVLSRHHRVVKPNRHHRYFEASSSYKARDREYIVRNWYRLSTSFSFQLLMGPKSLNQPINFCGRVCIFLAIGNTR